MWIVGAAAMLLMVSACASAPKVKVKPAAAAARRSVAAPALESMGSGEVDLAAARALLLKARPELKPEQWDLLDGKLLAAERARERYESLKLESARRSEELPPALGLVGVGAGSAVEGTVLIPVLVFLATVWPSSTAGPETDNPKWLGARLEYEACLRELSDAATEVRGQVEASRGKQSKVKTSTPPPPTVRVNEDGWVRVEGEPPWRPCKGIGSDGANSTAGQAQWIRCTYRCGRYEVEQHIFGKRTEDCGDQRNLDRAEQLAKRFHR